MTIERQGEGERQALEELRVESLSGGQERAEKVRTTLDEIQIDEPRGLTVAEYEIAKVRRQESEHADRLLLKAEFANLHDEILLGIQDVAEYKKQKTGLVRRVDPNEIAVERSIGWRATRHSWTASKEVTIEGNKEEVTIRAFGDKSLLDSSRVLVKISKGNLILDIRKISEFGESKATVWKKVGIGEKAYYRPILAERFDLEFFEGVLNQFKVAESLPSVSAEM